MKLLSVEGVSLSGIVSCLPAAGEDTLEKLTALTGDRAKAEAIVAATGIRTRRLAPPGVTVETLVVAAARRLLAESQVRPEAVVAMLAVSFTDATAMPALACRAQAALGLRQDVVALDVSLACSGYVYALYLAATLARDLGGPVLLLDGDVQSAVADPGDVATAAVLADAGTASLIMPSPGLAAWNFAFMTDGGEGAALELKRGGMIRMDGFGVYRFVATKVRSFLADFLAALGAGPSAFDAFVPHQANVYMIRQLAAALGFAPGQLVVSADSVGNSASASIPVALTRPSLKPGSRLCLAGFGGGLSAGAAALALAPGAPLVSFDYA